MFQRFMVLAGKILSRFRNARKRTFLRYLERDIYSRFCTIPAPNPHHPHTPPCRHVYPHLSLTRSSEPTMGERRTTHALWGSC